MSLLLVLYNQPSVNKIFHVIYIFLNRFLGVTRYVASLKLKNLHIDPLRVNMSSDEDYQELKRKVQEPLAEYLQEQLSTDVDLEIKNF